MRKILQTLGGATLQAARIVWASPWTIVGLTVGLIGMASGGRGRRGPGIFEFHGSAVTWLLERFGASAMTLGHTVLGRTERDLDSCQSHELVHVRQYERWGPFFIPAYLLCSFGLLLAGKHAYLDNPFEREAFEDDARRGRPLF